MGLIYDQLTEGAYEKAHAERIKPYLSLGIHTMPMQRSLAPSDLWAVIRLNRLVSNLSPNIIHSHGAKGGAYARMVAALRQMTRHPPVGILYSPHGGSLHYEPRSLKGRIFFTLERFFEYWTSSLVFVCHHEARVYAEKIGSPRCKATVVHNGLREEEFRPLYDEADPVDFLFFGTLRDLKGPDVFLEALAALPKQTKAALVGDGPDRQLYEEMVKTLSLQDRVTFHGALPAREAFAKARCVVLPSRAESFPYAVLEALAAGKPVITTRVGGIPEIFATPDNRLAAPGDSVQLRTMMADFLDNTPTWQDRAYHEQSHISQHFHADMMASTITTLYQNLLDSPGGEAKSEVRSTGRIK